MKYRMYLETDLNRVFTKSLGSIAAAELEVILRNKLETQSTQITHVEEGRTAYLVFQYEGDQQALLDELARLSAAAAVFAEHSARSLEPLTLNESLAFGTEVVTAQRYKGKTSERLTRLMLNLALSTDRSACGDGWTVLDPMCGRGTTLNWALLYGGRSTGLDVDRKALDEYALFLERWAKKNRLPHKLQRYRKQNSECRHFDFTVAADRQHLADKPNPDIRTFNAPADAPSLPVGRHSMIVSDLPYGIQHRPRSDADLTPTSVGELVSNVSSRWIRWVQPRGSMALSWNVKSLSRARMLEILAESDVREVPTRRFEHEVDRMITRDIVVASAPPR